MQSKIRDVQLKILEIMKFIDKLCRDNNIEYFIMGGTALGAIRHNGFIPWDDDLDIFMTFDNYSKFKGVFNGINDARFYLQEWKTTKQYLEYAKVRMNGTTFIEENLKDRKDIHHGIYVDIMILHKVPDNKFVQKRNYRCCKFVTLLGLSQRNWKPKTTFQKIALIVLKFLPKKIIANICYRNIYKYDNLLDNFKWCYWITPAKFKNGLFEKTFFQNPIDIQFEDTKLMGSRNIIDYLSYRYGDYMKIPSDIEKNASVHAFISDVNNDYTYYFN